MATMTLQHQLTGLDEHFQEIAPPEVFNTLKTVNKNFKASYDPKSALQVGQTLPEFRLSNAVGEEVNSTDLLAQGALLITFYRGEWCPFCNLALAAMQKQVDEFKAKGVTLVAISPELPNRSLTTIEKHNLKFPVLSDVGNKYAKQLGILFQQPDSLRPIFHNFGNNLAERNGDDSLVVPIPATFLVDRNGVVRNSFIDPDWVKRLEPATALEWIDALQD